MEDKWSRYCTVFGVIELILGTIGSFVLANKLGYSSDTGIFDLERDWILTISIFIGSMFIVGIISIILFAVGSIIDNQIQINVRLERITEMLYSLSKQDSPQINSNFWKCPKCGKRNAAFVGTCDCGAAKPGIAVHADPDIPDLPSGPEEDIDYNSPSEDTVMPANTVQVSGGLLAYGKDIVINCNTLQNAKEITEYLRYLDGQQPDDGLTGLIQQLEILAASEEQYGNRKETAVKIVTDAFKV